MNGKRETKNRGGKSMGKFMELSKCKIGENKNLVISRAGDGSISIAQQLIARSNGNEIGIFLKNSIVVDGKDGLENIKKTIESAIEKL